MYSRVNFCNVHKQGSILYSGGVRAVVLRGGPRVLLVLTLLLFWVLVLKGLPLKSTQPYNDDLYTFVLYVMLRRKD